MATQTPTTPVRAVLRNAANVVLSNTAFTSVFASKPVAAITYEIEANLLVSIGAAAAVSLILQLTGPAVGAETNVKWRASYEAGTGESVFAGHSTGSLASVTLPAGATFPELCPPITGVIPLSTGYARNSALTPLAGMRAVGTTGRTRKITRSSCPLGTCAGPVMTTWPSTMRIAPRATRAAVIRCSPSCIAVTCAKNTAGPSRSDVRGDGPTGGHCVTRRSSVNGWPPSAKPEA